MWNPLPLIDPETGELAKSVRKRRVLKTARDVSASAAAPPPAATPAPPPRREELQMEDVLQVPGHPSASSLSLSHPHTHTHTPFIGIRTLSLKDDGRV